MPLDEISTFLGHASLDSTQRYTHLAHEHAARDGADAPPAVHHADV
jgi:site-specific recombinase XerC